MDRRKAMKVAAGVFAGGGIGLVTLTNAFKPKKPVAPEPTKLDYAPTETNWGYVPLDPGVTAQLAYDSYSDGGCMYATVKSIIAPLAEKAPDVYASFPVHMFKYGHGGVGGYGTVCGTLNGAAAIIGLLVPEKEVQDKLIADLFHWYEKEPFPSFVPAQTNKDIIVQKSTSNSVLCHASNSNWCKTSGFSVTSKERKERCRRLTADVAAQVAVTLNALHANEYIANTHSDNASNTCLACHGKEGKVKNASVKMSCNSCHTESLGHRVFSDVHYKLIKD